MTLVDRFRDWRHRVYGFNIYNRRQWVARHASRLPAGRRVALLLLWLVSVPMVRLAGPLGRWLDGIGPGSVGTAGYHVLAARRGAAPLIVVAR